MSIRIQSGAVEFARRYPDTGRFHFVVDGVRDVRVMRASSSLADLLDYARRVRSRIYDDGIPRDVEVQFW